MTSIKKQYAALIGGTCIFGLGIFWGFIFPLMNETKAIQTETVTLVNKLSTYRKSLDMVNSYIKRRDSLDQRQVELTARLYARDDMLALIGRLKELSESYDVVVKEISPSVVELLAMNERPLVDGSPQQVNISLRISGEAAAAGQLLKEMEQEPYFVDLISLHVVGRDQGQTLAEYVFHFRAQLGSLPVKSMVLR